MEVHAEPPANADAANAYVQFGYAEWGGPSSYFCTSRAEACVVSAKEVSQKLPFYFATTESSQIPGAPCAKGCSISVPAISGRILYYQVFFRNASGAVVATGDPAVSVVP